jgi:hypothetical protein
MKTKLCFACIKSGAHFSAFALTALILIHGLAATPGVAADGTPDKSRYHLLKPTPRAEMREFATDRPDKTESPYTVDAGHYQIETDLVTYTYDRSGIAGSETQVRSYSTMATNFKAGLTHSIDFQAIITPYTFRETDATGSAREKKKGLGDTTLRLKVNLMGNDSGPVALGVMPFVKLPTAGNGLSNKRVEGGVILPAGIALPNDWALGAMIQVNQNKNEANDEMHTKFITSMTLGHDIVGNLAGYAEIFSQASSEYGSNWIATFDLGLTYALTEDVQLDIGNNFGVTKAADDMNPFAGISARF